jgi:hypothetical protein
MHQKVKVIKRGVRKEPERGRLQQPTSHPTREITTTIKLWISEFKQRRRTDEDRSRIGNKLMHNAESVG